MTCNDEFFSDQLGRRRIKVVTDVRLQSTPKFSLLYRRAIMSFETAENPILAPLDLAIRDDLLALGRGEGAGRVGGAELLGQ